MLFVVMVASAIGFIATLTVSIVLALFASDPPWWGPVTALGVLLIALIAWFLALSMCEAAGYLDGEEAEGTLVEVTADDRMGPESNPAYDMLLVAELSGGGQIRRAAREYPREAPLPGQRVRFRHNTRDPEDLDDILFLGFIDGTVQRPGDEEV
ncbi:hypothetical protein [Gordonia humi]|uniref:Uncharacterized protein n=1 Tax=Gordonia humi TaxID=686429 RepID=A0A840EUM1_9ACTN|nr:hypothetical protein [Gordonia humi]MBB4134003.1 hypothetical protein [Gordonia humi]